MYALLSKKKKRKSYFSRLEDFLYPFLLIIPCELSYSLNNINNKFIQG